MAPKSGIRSTEFYIVILVLAAANVMPFIAERYSGSEAVQVVAEVVRGAVDVLVALGYIIMRTSAKKAASKGFADPIGLILLTGLLFAAMFLAGCSVDEEWVKADRLTYDAIAPEYTEYVKADAALTPNQKDIRLTLIQTWRIKIEEWEKTLKAD